MSQSVLLPKQDPGPEGQGPGGQGPGGQGATQGEILSLVRLVRRVAIFVLGMTVVLVGVVMLVTPGPAFLVIPLGLAILATEFVWARRILERLKARLRSATASGGREPPEGPQPD